MNINSEFIIALTISIICSAPILFACHRLWKWLEAGGLYYKLHPGAKLMDVDKLPYDEALMKVNSDKTVR